MPTAAGSAAPMPASPAPPPAPASAELSSPAAAPSPAPAIATAPSPAPRPVAPPTRSSTLSALVDRPNPFPMQGSVAGTARVDGAQPAAPMAAPGFAADAAPARQEAEAHAMAKSARDPAEWLKAIEKLRADGRTEQAAKELVEFRRAYPQYALPDKLKELLPKP